MHRRIDGLFPFGYRLTLHACMGLTGMVLFHGTGPSQSPSTSVATDVEGDQEETVRVPQIPCPLSDDILEHAHFYNKCDSWESVACCRCVC